MNIKTTNVMQDNLVSILDLSNILLSSNITDDKHREIIETIKTLALEALV